MRLKGFLLIASLSALSVPAAAWGAPLYSEMIVFGDSLSDTGNVHIASTALGQLPDPPPLISTAGCPTGRSGSTGLPSGWK